jgi:hypothetical protein
MHPHRLAPPLGFHLVTFVAAILAATLCGWLTLVAWLVATLWLLGLLAPTSHATSNNVQKTCQPRHANGKRL